MLPAGATLRTGPGGRVVAALPGSLLALDTGGALDLARLDTEGVQAILNAGSLALVVLQMPGGTLQVATPRGVAELRAPGRYLIEAGDAARPSRLAVFAGAARLVTAAGAVPADAGQAAFVPPEGLGRLGPAGPQAPLVGWLAGEAPEPGSIVRPDAPPEPPRPPPFVLLERQVLVPYPVFVPVHRPFRQVPPHLPGHPAPPAHGSSGPPPFSGAPPPPLVPPPSRPAAASPLHAPLHAPSHAPPAGHAASPFRGGALSGPAR